MTKTPARRQSTAGRTKNMVGLAIFTAIIIVLTVICTFIKFGPFSITLALAPIIVGAAMYGCGAGAYLGFVFGAVVLITGLFGWDRGTVLYLMSLNSLATIALCIVKGAAAGLCAGAVYKLVSGKSILAGVLVAAVVCPVVNTGLFIIGMLAFFFDTLTAWAGGTALINYIIVGIVGINFIIELLVNLLLSSGIARIIKIGKSM